MTALKSYWTFYTNWLRDKLPLYHSYLNSGASKEEINKLQSNFSFDLPDELTELYQINNGDNSLNQNIPIGTFMQFEFLCIPRLLSEYNQYKKIIDNDPSLNLSGLHISHPEGIVKKEEFNPKWIPIFTDGSGNYIGVDLDPDTNGVYGQVINFGRDEYMKFQIAKSLTDFFEFIKQKVESGECDDSIVEEDEGEYSYGISSESHLLDDLRQIHVEE